MLCRISDLLVEVPKAGGMAPRCREYLTDTADGADIIIRSELLKPETMPELPEETAIYLQTGFMFYVRLLRFQGMMLHASAVEHQGKAYLFSGHCGAGKSTHTKLWKQIHGEQAQVFNDDKPALRRLDGRWYAYGTPWCGKDGINQNKKVPLAGICFLKQADHNSIKRLNPQQALQRILPQTMYKLHKRESIDRLMDLLGCLIEEIPVFELENRPEEAAAWLSSSTMRTAAEEMNL